MVRRIKLVMISLLLFGLFTLLASGALITGLGMAFYGEFSNQWDNGDLVPASNSVIYDGNGKPVAELHGAENRVLLSYDKIPLQLKTAFLAVEDNRFYQHPGLDIQGIIRSALVDVQEGELAQGGSTITMQLVRNAFLSKEKTWLRKVKELIMARELELRYSKDEILGMYLNRIYFGHGVYGVQAASRLFFGKNVDKLQPQEVALLAGIPKNPSYYSPYRNPEATLQRRNLVLTIMEGSGVLPPMEADQARSAALKVVGLSNQHQLSFPYFIDQVITEAATRYGIKEDDLYRGGYKIYSTLDPQVQRVAEATLANKLNFPPDSGGVLVQGAIATVDYHKGEIRALVGGRNYQAVRGFNRAVQLRRQPGSAIKPLVVYAPGLEQGIPVNYRINSQLDPSSGYQPQNYGGRSFGVIDMTFALKNSVNVYAVKLLQEIGVDAGFKMGRALGLPLLDSDRGLALALGGLTKGVSPLEMAGAFGTFGADGIFREPITISRIVDGQGLDVKGKKPRQEPVMSTNTARVMTTLLEEVIDSGTGREASLGTLPNSAKVATVTGSIYGEVAKVPTTVQSKPVYLAAGKTGTVQLPDLPAFKGVQGDKDAWFVGYTPRLVTAVWIGFDRTDREHYLKGVTGGSYPARIWKQVMERVSPS